MGQHRYRDGKAMTPAIAALKRVLPYADRLPESAAALVREALRQHELEQIASARRYGCRHVCAVEDGRCVCCGEAV